ncbi:hypothetical protein ACJW31_10G031100 [Castanea mollissima]
MQTNRLKIPNRIQLMPCIYSMTLITFFFPFSLGLAQGLFNLYIRYIASIIIELLTLWFNRPTATITFKVLSRNGMVIHIVYLAFIFTILALFWLLLLHFSHQRSMSCGHTSAHHQQEY